MESIKIDKFGSATARLRLPAELKILDGAFEPASGDVVVVRALSESVTYGNLELPSGRLAKAQRAQLRLAADSRVLHCDGRGHDGLWSDLAAARIAHRAGYRGRGCVGVPLWRAYPENLICRLRLV